MSESSTHNHSWLNRAHLKGYKSIRDCEIEFKPGLNIIIGKNGTGKTNLLEYLNGAIGREVKFPGNDFSISQEVKGEEYQLRSLKTTHLKNPKSLIHRNAKPTILTTPKGEEIEIGGSFSWLNSNLAKINIPLLFSFNRPKNLVFCDTPLEGNIFDFEIQDNGLHSSFLTFMYAQLTLDLVREESSEEKFEEEETADVKTIIQERIDALTDVFDSVSKTLKRFSPIEKIRFAEGFEIREGKLLGDVWITNLKLEFFSQNQWLLFNQLSDGSKRIFLLISGILSITLTNQYWGIGASRFPLIEEPELGIHPDQLFQLMTFIKEQSHDMQIILTTHSPVVLDVLGPDELDRILITTFDRKNGTQVHRLSEKQQQGIRGYLEDGFKISDAWLHSPGFENRPEA